MGMIKLCIFDMDGLLIDSAKGMWLVNEKRSIEELGYKFDYDLITFLMGSSMAEYKKTIVEFYGKDFPVDTYYDMVYRYNAIMINNNELKLMGGVISLLDFLKTNNIKMRVATSTPLNIATEMLTNLNIIDYFERIVSGQDVKRGKPYPDVYNEAVKDYNKDEALIFEDGHNGARAAIASGIKLVLVPDIAKVTKQDKDEAFKVIEHLDLAINIIKELNNIK